jgi:multiple sugar transport system permease protein
MSLVRSAPATSHRKSSGLQKGLIYLALLLCTLLFLAPLLGNVLLALKNISELAAFPVHILPAHWEWGNFLQALTLIPFGQYLVNSLILGAIYTSLVTLSSALVGFSFARLRARGKGLLFLIMLSTIMLPPIMTVIPTYVIFAQFQIIDTYWPWVLWGLASSPYYSFLFRQFFSSIPIEMEEAAILDGCGYWRIFWQIFLPLSFPAIATVVILSFTSVWGDFFAPAIFLSNDKMTLAVAISNGYTDASQNVLTNIQAAGTIFYILPVLLLVFFAQRYFVRGIVTSGLKG